MVNIIGTKVFVNHLKPFLPKVVSEIHLTFMKGRLINDNIVLSFEMPRSLKHNTQWKEGDVVLTIDISKAFNKLTEIIYGKSWSNLTLQL